MLIQTNPPFLRRRSRTQRAGTLPPVGALTVLSVGDIAYDVDFMYVTAVFDTTGLSPLSSVGAAAAGKWNARYDGKRFEGYSLALLAFNQIRIGLSLADDEPGSDELNYTNAPSDISDVLGRQLGAFAGMAI